MIRNANERRDLASEQAKDIALQGWNSLAPTKNFLANLEKMRIAKLEQAENASSELSSSVNISALLNESRMIRDIIHYARTNPDSIINS